MKRIIQSALLACCTFLASACATAQSVETTQISTLNGDLKTETRIPELTKSNTTAQISPNNAVSKQNYRAIISHKEKMVKIMSKASTKSRAVNKLQGGSPIHILKNNGNWLKISWHSGSWIKEGWIHKRHVEFLAIQQIY